MGAKRTWTNPNLFLESNGRRCGKFSFLETRILRFNQDIQPTAKHTFFYLDLRSSVSICG
jgi:hypothetical protein